MRFPILLTPKQTKSIDSIVIRQALDRMVMQSDLRDIYHGIGITEFRNSSITDPIHRHQKQTQVVEFYLQLSDNMDEQRIVDVLRANVQSNNYSVGGTDLYTDESRIDQLLSAVDFDECHSQQFHDCSVNAHCFNLRGTYTCSCTDGYADLSVNSVYPGRQCSAELIGCERCHYHGKCINHDFTDTDSSIQCECFPWYTGDNCQVNLKGTFNSLCYLL